jgi:HSP20 family protein
MTNMIKRENNNGTVSNRLQLPLDTWVDGMLKNTFDRYFGDEFFGFDRMAKSGTVPVNITDGEKAYTVEFMVPGLNKEELSVNVANNILTVSYDHREENKQEQPGKNYVRQEFVSRSFSRSFTLDETVDAENISGEYVNGVLRVTIPKKEGINFSKHIEIR